MFEKLDDNGAMDMITMVMIIVVLAVGGYLGYKHFNPEKGIFISESDLLAERESLELPFAIVEQTVDDLGCSSYSGGKTGPKDYTRCHNILITYYEVSGDTMDQKYQTMIDALNERGYNSIGKQGGIDCSRRMMHQSNQDVYIDGYIRYDDSIPESERKVERHRFSYSDSVSSCLRAVPYKNSLYSKLRENSKAGDRFIGLITVAPYE